MALQDYEIRPTKYLEEVKQIHDLFKKKRQLERDIVELILAFERDTGVAIDIVRYERDITMPIHHKSYYTDLKIVIGGEERNEENE